MLLFASQIVNIGFGLLAIFITLLADEISLQPIEIGVVISIFMVARAFSAGIIPGISDKIGRRTILIVALFMYALSTMMLGFARDFGSLLFLRVIEGASAGAVFPTAEALLVDSVPVETRGAWMGKYFTTFNLGFILGPAIGGLIFTFGVDFLHLETLVAFTLPFVFTGILGFISLLTTIFLVKDVIKESDHPSLSEEVEAISNTRTPYMIPFIIVAVFSGFSIGLIIPIFTLHMSDAFLLTEGNIGFLFTISGTFALVVNYPAGRLSDMLTNRLYIVIISTV
jgi:DHA1 family quinolone resistance protein-like MFS transporter